MIVEGKNERKNGCKAFCLKYFWEGQNLKEGAVDRRDPNASFLNKYRRQLALFGPAVVYHIIWWTVMIAGDYFHLYVEGAPETGIPGYYLALTMVVGGTVAGMTSEGGGTIAFPVMTLVFGIGPAIARDFSLMIQSAGMTAASFSILFMKVQVENHALKYVTVGGITGIIFGLEFVAPHLPSDYAKMIFVSVFFTFAFALYQLNRTHDRPVFDTIPDFEVYRYRYSFLLISVGFVGGILSGISGSGIDICSFSILTLLFRVSEKVATPTSVVLMGINTVFGFGYVQFFQGGVEGDALHFWPCAIPVVVIMAPLGSILGSHFHRLVLAYWIYISDTLALLTGIIVIQPWKDTGLSITTIVVIIFGALFFSWIARLGESWCIDQYKEEKEVKPMMESPGPESVSIPTQIELGQENSKGPALIDM